MRIRSLTLGSYEEKVQSEEGYTKVLNWCQSSDVRHEYIPGHQSWSGDSKQDPGYAQSLGYLLCAQQMTQCSRGPPTPSFHNCLGGRTFSLPVNMPGPSEGSPPHGRVERSVLPAVDGHPMGEGGCCVRLCVCVFMCVWTYMYVSAVPAWRLYDVHAQAYVHYLCVMYIHELPTWMSKSKLKYQLTIQCPHSQGSLWVEKVWGHPQEGGADCWPSGTPGYMWWWYVCVCVCVCTRVCVCMCVHVLCECVYVRAWRLCLYTEADSFACKPRYSLFSGLHQYIKILNVCVSVCLCVCVTEVRSSGGGSTVVMRDLRTYYTQYSVCVITSRGT